MIKHTAVLRRKEEQQRNFLTKLNEINSNVREAEKLFSSDGFAEQALREAEELMEGTPPDDDKRREASFEAASAVADFFSGLKWNSSAKRSKPAGNRRTRKNHKIIAARLCFARRSCLRRPPRQSIR